MATALEEAPFVMCRVDLHRLNPHDILPPPGVAAPESGPWRYPVHPHWDFNLGGTLGFTRATYEALGPFDPRFTCALDLEYCFRAHRAGVPITPVPDAVMHYRLRPTLQGVFRQRRSWGREYPVVGALYGADWGRHPRLREARKVVSAVLGVAVAAVAAGRPDGRRHLYDAVAHLGFTLGSFEGIGHMASVRDSGRGSPGDLGDEGEVAGVRGESLDFELGDVALPEVESQQHRG
jgi:hypothetical protein